MSQDYIFCPLCGGVSWITDKTAGNAAGRITYHKCKACKKFSYQNITASVDHPTLTGITKTTRYSVNATIKNIIIEVKYHDNTTTFTDSDSKETILKLNSCVTFNWYKNEELMSKIKKYIVFS